MLREVLAVLKTDQAFTPGSLTREMRRPRPPSPCSPAAAVAACARGLAHSTFYSVIDRHTRPDRDDGLDGAVARALPGGRRGGRGYRFVTVRASGSSSRPVSEKRVRRSMAKQGFGSATRAAGASQLLQGREHRPARTEPPAPGRTAPTAFSAPAALTRSAPATSPQFSLPDGGKVYWRDDLFDGKPVGWSAGMKP